MARKTWRCFHCDEVFTSPRLAAEHFGDEMYSTPACQIGGLRPMVTLIREQERQLRSYRCEDTSLLRTLWSIESDHNQALRREEEKGYERGLRDSLFANPGSLKGTAYQVIFDAIAAATSPYPGGAGGGIGVNISVERFIGSIVGDGRRSTDQNANRCHVCLAPALTSDAALCISCSAAADRGEVVYGPDTGWRLRTGPALLAGCDVEVCAGQEGSRRASDQPRVTK